MKTKNKAFIYGAFFGIEVYLMLNHLVKYEADVISVLLFIGALGWFLYFKDLD